MRNVPGRKTDMADAEWICRLMEHGLVRASFVPPKEIRELRDLTRFRKTRIEERTREAQPPGQDPQGRRGEALKCRLGRSGRDILVALVAGSRDPEISAELARGQLRRKLPALQVALTGRFGAHHTLLVSEVLSLLDTWTSPSSGCRPRSTG
jgi:transposase